MWRGECYQFPNSITCVFSVGLICSENFMPPIFTNLNFLNFSPILSSQDLNLHYMTEICKPEDLRPGCFNIHHQLSCPDWICQHHCLKVSHLNLSILTKFHKKLKGFLAVLVEKGQQFISCSGTQLWVSISCKFRFPCIFTVSTCVCVCL